MPRTPRSLIGDAYIHNMIQGINREYIFQSSQQKYKYIKLLKKYSQKYNILIISYCIMDNHVHILTYSDNIKNVSLFMKETNTEYAIYYNKQNNRVGYVFRNRFESKVIFNQEYLLKCIKYIHMNPVKAGIVKKESEYKFSSYNNYLNKDGFVNDKVIKNIFNSEEKYLEKFHSINYEPLNLEKEQIKVKEILINYLKEKNLNLGQIKNDKILIKKFISYLISNEYEFTQQDLAEALNISRVSLYRRLRKG